MAVGSLSYGFGLNTSRSTTFNTYFGIPLQLINTNPHSVLKRRLPLPPVVTFTETCLHISMHNPRVQYSVVLLSFFLCVRSFHSPTRWHSRPSTNHAPDGTNSCGVFSSRCIPLVTNNQDSKCTCRHCCIMVGCTPYTSPRDSHEDTPQGNNLKDLSFVAGVCHTFSQQRTNHSTHCNRPNERQETKRNCHPPCIRIFT